MRLIDADALEEMLIKSNVFYPEIFLSVIKNAPTIDPVRHGKWNAERYFYGIAGYRCSECGKEVDVWNEYVYCPHCGAKNDYEEK